MEYIKDMFILVQRHFVPPPILDLVFLLETEHSGLLLDVDLLQVLPHLHHLGQKNTENLYIIDTLA